MIRRNRVSLFVVLCVCFMALVLFSSFSFTVEANATNVTNYSDLISDSRPLGQANHTFTYTIKEDVAAGGYFDFDFPSGFIVPADSRFGIRNVEMYVNGIPRVATGTLSGTTDQVIITTGDGGSIRYNLNTTVGVSADDTIELRIGNHTSNSIGPSTSYSTSTGTTTSPGDMEPITNTSVVGNQLITMTTGGTTETVYADFYVVIIRSITTGNVDTTETVPPHRFNGAPSSTIGGTTLNVEISLETDELATCRYSTTASTSYSSMSNTFEVTGQIVHTQEVAVVNETTYFFYVRCIDDENNFNIDDYIITFSVPEEPTGDINGDGNNDGDGSGTGDGSSGGSGSSGSGSSGGGGGSSGSGGSGGGSGGTSGGGNDSNSGGGFEDDDRPYASGDATVIINGYAFPGSTVYALVDGTVTESVTANNTGRYSVTIENIARGVYTFGIYAIDDNEVKSSTFSTSFTVTGGKTSSLSNINIMPTIKVDPDPVVLGQSMTVTGFSIPDAEITVENQKDGSSLSLKTFTTSSDSDGRWILPVDASRFIQGTYKIRAKAKQQSGLGLSTEFSNYTYYGVGTDAEVSINADLNRDGRVNLTDFSILLFWWGSDGGASDPPADINGDTRVSLTDFSILLFNWTG